MFKPLVLGAFLLITSFSFAQTIENHSASINVNYNYSGLTHQTDSDTLLIGGSVMIAGEISLLNGDNFEWGGGFGIHSTHSSFGQIHVKEIRLPIYTYFKINPNIEPIVSYIKMIVGVEKTLSSALSLNSGDAYMRENGLNSSLGMFATKLGWEIGKENKIAFELGYSMFGLASSSGWQFSQHNISAGLSIKI
jgi:hypothetical protein